MTDDVKATPELSSQDSGTIYSAILDVAPNMELVVAAL